MSDDLPWLHAELLAVERRVRQAVAAFRARDPLPDDPFRGLYLSDDKIDTLLGQPRGALARGGLEGAPEGRAGALAERAGLTRLDLTLLLVALLPDLDSRYEQLYGYLNDDVTRRRATAGLALRLAGLPEGSPGRFRLAAHAPLIAFDLLRIEEPDRPFLSRSLIVPDCVTAYLLGGDVSDPELLDLRSPADVTGDSLPDADRLGRALRDGIRLVYVRERPGGSAAELACGAIGTPPLHVDAARLCERALPRDAARAVLREALLTGATVVLGPVGGASRPTALPSVLRLLTSAPIPVVVYGPADWDPEWSAEVPLIVEAAPLPPGSRARIWRETLNGAVAPDVDPVAATRHFMLNPGQIRRAGRAATLAARAMGEPLTAAHLRLGARAQNSATLERLARRIDPAVSWDDLVLPARVLAELRELSARALLRDRVLGEWRMRPGGGRGRGVCALFAGDSGTGKTMSAEVVAAELGLDLYVINLATVVDKYIGETEKNLERVFSEAAGVNAVLLFDEADAIFGKRSEVREANDRYANIESAYLLQRMESFDGIAVLATNLRANLDEAFTRRLDLVVEFPAPDVPLRRVLWDRCIGPLAPRATDIDLDFLAGAFELAGGHIRSASVTAAYLAAAADRPVGMTDLIGAVAVEYRKLGRLRLDREFGPYLPLVTAREER